MKKVLILLLTAALTLGMLAGCSKGNTALDSKNPTTIIVWHYFDSDLRISFENKVEEFNLSVGLEKGVIVEAQAMGNITDLEQSVTDSAQGIINSAPMPDIFFSYADKAMEISQYTDLVDLTEYFSEDELSGYVQDFVAEGYIDGKLLVLPMIKSSEVIYVNNTAFAEFCAATGHTGADLATFEQLLDTARDYYTYSGGTALFGIDTVANYIVIGNKQLGVDILAGDGSGGGQAVLNKNALRRVFELYYTGYGMGYFGAIGRFRSDDVKTGDLVSYAGSSSGVSFFPTQVEMDGAAVDIDFAALTYPTFEGAERYTIQQGAGVCISADDEASREGSALFLKWFTSLSSNVDFLLQTGYLPVHSDLYSSQEMSDGLAALAQGPGADLVTAGVYDISRDQIVNGRSYSVTPFEGSYGARYLLEDVLVEITGECIEQVAALRAGGMDDDEILAGLDVESAFQEYINTVSAGLESRGIAYIVE